MVFASKCIQSPTERGRRLNNFHLNNCRNSMNEVIINDNVFIPNIIIRIINPIVSNIYTSHYLLHYGMRYSVWMIPFMSMLFQPYSCGTRHLVSLYINYIQIFKISKLALSTNTIFLQRFFS